MEPAWTTMGIVYARGASSNNMGVSVREKEILDTYRRLSVALIIANQCSLSQRVFIIANLCCFVVVLLSKDTPTALK